MLYSHKVSPSIESRLIQLFMGLIGMKRAMERKILNNSYSKKPSSIPKSIQRRFSIDIEEYNGRKVWTISPKNRTSSTVTLFFHGGAYYANITPMHWQLINNLLDTTSATFVVPDYPLAPESTCTDTYQFLDAVYAKLITEYSSKKFVFMGDSAGGGLALGFAQKIRNEGQLQPEHIILFSPWLDASMDNPGIAELDKYDRILNVNGLKIAGENYSGKLDVKDFRVSPIYGNFSNLGKISIFIGTNEVLIADVRLLKQLLKDQKIDFNYFEYPGMFHDWVVVKQLIETRDVLEKVSQIIK